MSGHDQIPFHSSYGSYSSLEFLAHPRKKKYAHIHVTFGFLQRRIMKKIVVKVACNFFEMF